VIHFSRLFFRIIWKGAKCAKEKMVDIECRTVKTHIPAKGTGLDVECSLERGLVCKSSMKGKACQDFEIRVRCECG
jgi:von Willebrand factor